MSKRFRFSITRNLEAMKLTWRDKVTSDTLTLAVSELEDSEDVDFFTLYGLQKFHEDRTSGVDSDSKLEERAALWAQIKEHGHTWQKPREGGIGQVSVEVEAVARLKDVEVSAIQKSRKGYTKEQWEKITSHPQVVELIEEIRAERAESEDVDLGDLLS